MTANLRATAPNARAAVGGRAGTVDCAVYVDGARLPGQFSHTGALAQVRERGDGFVWLGLHEPTAAEMQDVAEVFGLHELAVEDILEGTHLRPKLDRYDDSLFMVLLTVRYVEHDSPTTANEIVETGSIMTFLGRDYIVTIRRGQHSSLSKLRTELEAQPDRLAEGPAVVLHAICDHVVDRYLKVSDAVENDIDTVESLVFAPRSPISAEQIYLMKREIVELRHAVTPLITPLRRLAAGHSRFVPEQIRSYFRDVEDHLAAVSEQVASYDDLITTLVEATLAKVSLQQNSDMRKITAWAAILAVPTMAAGIYGMNFDYMPELHWKYGYPVLMAVIGVACLLVHRAFKKNGWL